MALWEWFGRLKERRQKHWNEFLKCLSIFRYLFTLHICESLEIQQTEHRFRNLLFWVSSNFLFHTYYKTLLCNSFGKNLIRWKWCILWFIWCYFSNIPNARNNLILSWFWQTIWGGMTLIGMTWIWELPICESWLSADTRFNWRTPMWISCAHRKIGSRIHALIHSQSFFCKFQHTFGIDDGILSSSRWNASALKIPLFCYNRYWLHE